MSLEFTVSPSILSVPVEMPGQLTDFSATSETQDGAYHGTFTGDESYASRLPHIFGPVESVAKCPQPFTDYTDSHGTKDGGWKVTPGKYEFDIHIGDGDLQWTSRVPVMNYVFEALPGRYVGQSRDICDSLVDTYEYTYTRIIKGPGTKTVSKQEPFSVPLLHDWHGLLSLWASMNQTGPVAASIQKCGEQLFLAGGAYLMGLDREIEQALNDLRTDYEHETHQLEAQLKNAQDNSELLTKAGVDVASHQKRNQNMLDQLHEDFTNLMQRLSQKLNVVRSLYKRLEYWKQIPVPK